MTIFGDAVLHRNAPLPVAELRRITGRLGIEDGALRTALSRLASEGWLDRQRNGRNSLYALSAHRKREAQDAAKIIYRASLKSHQGGWVLAMGEMSDRKGAVRLGKTVQVWSAALDHEAPNSEMLVLQGDAQQIPNWVAKTVVPDQIAHQIEALLALLAGIGPVAQLEAIDALTLRITIAHFWRRIVLKLPAYPADLMPEGWQGEECLRALANIYQCLAPLSETAFFLPNQSPSEVESRFK